MFYTYVLYSEFDHNLYVGFTKDLELRIKQHNNGEVQSTKSRLPLTLIYFESCVERWDAIRREKYLKTHYGRMFLKKRLKAWYEANA